MTRGDKRETGRGRTRSESGSPSGSKKKHHSRHSKAPHARNHHPSSSRRDDGGNESVSGDAHLDDEQPGDVHSGDTYAGTEDDGGTSANGGDRASNSYGSHGDGMWYSSSPSVTEYDSTISLLSDSALVQSNTEQETTLNDPDGTLNEDLHHGT